MRNGLLFSLIILSALPALSLSAERDSAVIQNSGSTNTSGFTITVWSDGTSSVSVRGQADHAFTLQPDLRARFFSDLQAASTATSAPRHCMKSASFGTTTSVRWHGWSSLDLQCPPLPPSVAALANDVAAIETAAGVTGGPHRIGLPPSLRKIPLATPEVQPT
jgi:hypothetical protein